MHGARDASRACPRSLFRRPSSVVLALHRSRSGLLAALAAPGCRHEAENHYTSVAEPPTVRLTKPQVRKIVRVVGQPSFIQSYERSSVYPKMNAYIEKWIVDIGDKVKKGDVLAHLFVPELVEDHETKQATVVLDRERIALAKEVVEVAKADVDGGRGAARGGAGGARQLPGRGRALGLGGQAAPRRGRPGRGHSAGSAPVDQSVEGFRRRRETRRRRPF